MHTHVLNPVKDSGKDSFFIDNFSSEAVLLMSLLANWTPRNDYRHKARIKFPGRNIYFLNYESPNFQL